MEVSCMSEARIEVSKKTCLMHILLIGVSHRSGTLNGYFRLAIKNVVNFFVPDTGLEVVVE